MTKTLKVALIGAGGIAQGVHIPNYKKAGDKVDIVAIADVVKEKAEACAKAHDIPQVFTDYHEMFENVEIDAVSVCTPNKFHAPAVIAALNAGCHVICEKPPAMTPEEAEAMADAAKKAGKFLTYGFHYRFAPEVQTVKRFIDAGELGHIYAANVIAMRRRGIPGWGVFTNKELQGGGPLIDIGVHMLDTALYLMDYPEPESVYGVTYQEIGIRKGVGLFGDWDWENFSVEDMARAMIRFKNGASIQLDSSFAANIEHAETMNVKLMGDQGGANVFPLKIFQEKHGALTDLTPVHLPKYGFHDLEIERFVDACLSDTAPLSTPEQGVAIQKIINAIYESAEAKKSIHF
ncbi:Gfo/Idh/MocA family protein [Camelliibacillus cellulosilyticus]|uniref:Gfo/Idh/MocA family protein n=1 Tax=Camelliibacillus cellulosilyticus TaxID=2174486 RepID=A0ABV9GP90_9BACL